jgi:hypothetical protein
MQMHRTSMKALVVGAQLPQLGTIIKVGALLGLNPYDLLTGEHTNPPIEQAPIDLQVHRQQPLRKFDKENVLKSLRRILEIDEFPPPSMASIAKRLGYDHSFLINHFPEECHAISHNASR